MKRILNLIYPLISVGIVIAACYVFSYAMNSNIVAPSPTEVFKEFCALFSRSDFWKCVSTTLWRSTYGFSLALATALAFALAASASKTVERILYPITAIVRAIPTMAVILLCLIFLRSKKTPAAVSYIVVFPMLYSALLGVFTSRDRELMQMLKVYGVRKRDIFFKYSLPDAVLRLFPQLVTTYSFNIKLTVSGEAMAWTSQSIGASMMIAKSNVETAVLLAWALVAVVLAFAVELALNLLARVFVKVKNEYRNRKTVQALR